MKSKFTLREALAVYAAGPQISQIFQHIWKKDQGMACAEDRPTLEQTEKSYSKVITELLSKPSTKPDKMPICVRMGIDFFDKTDFVDVCFKNPKYVAPKRGLKPWGCRKGQKPPKGHYNVNSDKHNKYYAFGWTPWSKIIDTPIVVEGKAKKLPVSAVLGEILWEMTFYGWTEEKCDTRGKEIQGKIKDAEEDIKKGNFVELPPKKEGGYKVVIPDTVTKQIIDLINKRK